MIVREHDDAVTLTHTGQTLVPAASERQTVQTKNVAEAVRSRVGAALGRGRTAPPEAGAVAPKQRPRRLIVLALAAIMAALPISAAVQTVGAPKARASVDGRYAYLTTGAAATAFYFWLNNAHWPATGPSNAQFNTGQGYVNGGGNYYDNDYQLRAWINQNVNTQGRQLTFREYDGATRPNPWDNRGAERYVYNVEYGVVFHTGNHYADFTPLNFGSMPIPYFADRVYCYEFPAGQPNNRRIVLRNLRSNPVDYSVRGLPGSGMDVLYRGQYEYWHSGDNRYYASGGTWDRGFSIEAWPSFRIHNDPSSICRQWTGWWYGAWG